MHGFLQRIEGEQAECGLHRGGEVPDRPLMGEEPREDFEGELSQPLALAHEPVLEGRRDDAEAGQEIAAVETRGTLEPGRRALGHGLLERHDVRLHRPGGQGDRIARHDEATTLGGTERLAKHEERLAQRVPGGCGRRVRPEQRGQLVPGMRLVCGEGQISEEGLGLPGGHRDRRAGAAPRLEPPK